VKKYVVKIPFFVPYVYPKRLWHLSREKKTIYLTFDDGPIPVLTPWVLNELKKYNAKATFFCIGKNIEENAEIFKRLIVEGHAVGNHTHNHLNARITTDSAYLENVEMAQKWFERDSVLFRPPYGQLSAVKAKRLEEKGYKIIMWDVLSGDFDQTITEQECLENVIKNTENGSVVIFHDSVKAEKNLRYVFPRVLAHFSENGFAFEAIT
jgi:peptidoglycan/xylan/chitin deacetylase (PgdA/CDA1 family)